MRQQLAVAYTRQENWTPMASHILIGVKTPQHQLHENMGFCRTVARMPKCVCISSLANDEVSRRLNATHLKGLQAFGGEYVFRGFRQDRREISGLYY